MTDFSRFVNDLAEEKGISHGECTSQLLDEVKDFDMTFIEFKHRVRQFTTMKAELVAAHSRGHMCSHRQAEHRRMVNAYDRFLQRVADKCGYTRPDPTPGLEEYLDTLQEIAEAKEAAMSKEAKLLAESNVKEVREFMSTLDEKLLMKMAHGGIKYEEILEIRDEVDCLMNKLKESCIMANITLPEDLFNPDGSFKIPPFFKQMVQHVERDDDEGEVPSDLLTKVKRMIAEKRNHRRRKN